MIPRLRIALAAAVALLAATAPRGEVEVNSTVVVRAGPQARYGATTTSDTVAPLYEILRLAARDVRNPVAERLELVVSAWGAANLGSTPWWNGSFNDSRFSGDLELAYVKGELARGAVTARLGRIFAAGGNSRVIHLDGAAVLWRTPWGLTLSAFGGSPVASRFDVRGGPESANPAQGDVAAGARLAYVHRLFEAGVSDTLLWDRGKASRRELGGDVRFSPLPWLTLLGYTTVETRDLLVAETSASAIAQLTRQVSVSADYRRTVPSLFLSRESILWVFTDGSREDLGANVHWVPISPLSVDVGGSYLVNESGFRAGGRATWRVDRRTALGAEASYLDAVDNAYFLGRVFGSREFGRVAVTLDLQGLAFKRAVNQETGSFLGTATVGYPLGRGLTLAVAGSGGVTPYYRSRFDAMAKLVYQELLGPEARP